MEYKVGDKVRIKSIDWYYENRQRTGCCLINCGETFFTPMMLAFCGKTVTIIGIIDGCYIDKTSHFWTDDMIECKVGE